MGLLFELITNAIVFVTQPFSLLNLICAIGLRCTCLVTETWMQIVKAIINFNLNICWRITIWIVAIVSLPLRILNALQRERQLQMLLDEMQFEFENLAWGKKELEDRLRAAIKDRKIMESILEELEDDHEKAIARIELLENELQDLKEENLRLNKIYKKENWSDKSIDDRKLGTPFLTEYDTPALKPDYNGSGVTIQDLLMHRDSWEEDNKGKIQPHKFMKAGSKGGHVYELSPRVTPKSLVVSEALDEKRGVAMSQSLFSAVLSLLVGIIIWEAEDPCMPLVVALFSVVGMSLKSVVQFFSTIENKPASDAVALLSFNWFILGTLTYPTLPRVAHLLAPIVRGLITRILSWPGRELFALLASERIRSRFASTELEITVILVKLRPDL
ncbi:hypothetical protein GIB67_038424 [Kingdonia uniflora]|uniref:Uncharacterized protein n=1 Tax=Kingdonia uniflora TaxID=39325 RepID=A0A7J7NNY1_9MAGN|nr:hypothetical protein GIB67_038424 [Kingdonia uniflora]